MNICDFVNVLDRDQEVLIIANMASDFMRTTASEVPVTLLAKRIKKAYVKNNELVIETIDK